MGELSHGFKFPLGVTLSSHDSYNGDWGSLDIPFIVLILATWIDPMFVESSEMSCFESVWLG